MTAMVWPLENYEARSSKDSFIVPMCLILRIKDDGMVLSLEPCIVHVLSFHQLACHWSWEIEHLVRREQAGIFISISVRSLSALVEMNSFGVSPAKSLRLQAVGGQEELLSTQHAAW